MGAQGDVRDREAEGTNNSGPKPRHQPKAYFASTIGITGAAFCDQCGLGGTLNGDLVFGDVTRGKIRAIDLNATRSGFRGRPASVHGADGGALDGGLASRPDLLQRSDGHLTSWSGPRRTGPSRIESTWDRLRVPARPPRAGAAGGGGHGHRTPETDHRDRADLPARTRPRVADPVTEPMPEPAPQPRTPAEPEP